MITRKYNQRTRQWDVKIVKADKGYEYIPVLMLKILQRWAKGGEGVACIVDLNASDPAIISSTICLHTSPTNKRNWTKKQQVHQRTTISNCI